MKSQQIPRKWKSINLQASNTLKIIPNGVYMADLSDHYPIYDFARIYNLSNKNATIILNHSQEQPLPAGEYTTIQHQFGALAVRNDGVTDILANQIKINYGYNSTKSEFIEKGLSAGSWVGALIK